MEDAGTVHLDADPIGADILKETSTDVRGSLKACDRIPGIREHASG